MSERLESRGAIGMLRKSMTLVQRQLKHDLFLSVLGCFRNSIAMASNLIAIASNLIAMASNLVAMAPAT